MYWWLWKFGSMLWPSMRKFWISPRKIKKTSRIKKTVSASSRMVSLIDRDDRSCFIRNPLLRSDAGDRLRYHNSSAPQVIGRCPLDLHVDKTADRGRAARPDESVDLRRVAVRASCYQRRPVVGHPTAFDQDTQRAPDPAPVAL